MFDLGDGFEDVLGNLSIYLCLLALAGSERWACLSISLPLSKSFVEVPLDF